MKKNTILLSLLGIATISVVAVGSNTASPSYLESELFTPELAILTNNNSNIKVFMPYTTDSFGADDNQLDGYVIEINNESLLIFIDETIPTEDMLQNSTLSFRDKNNNVINNLDYQIYSDKYLFFYNKDSENDITLILDELNL
ncbi:MAG: hypothetical protein ATN35_10375 [Epulopiscium sp. Nele67-Bin004]|nr:MAG: hypothetical protein ATN35_10375 [Epulopiscium sp. Nele67-Bin004]